jgi:hypothetical protein
MDANSKDAKLLRATKFPPEFDIKVNTSKVNLEVLKKSVNTPSGSRSVLTSARFYRWIATKITAILGDEDEIVIETCFNLLEVERVRTLPTTIATPNSLLTGS